MNIRFSEGEIRVRLDPLDIQTWRNQNSTPSKLLQKFGNREGFHFDLLIQSGFAVNQVIDLQNRIEIQIDESTRRKIFEEKPNQKGISIKSKRFQVILQVDLK